ncbi:acyl-CoA dehydrogenase [Haematobacter massiliensis]|uniref:Acyl-CoA dehydrogenase n=2 Tax=Haematobacter massiliensis TaxID=195105 RepID=A0A086Y298_9RHOB|nr:acyl-CoA dehydrogenase family protein [Haematobacter massiliensis]KFI28398.1 acyl-CoA dehydrogenase [Haematobacter massiliensis]OWJ84661.1 acyl-CoA dehydrogenase [Haematobacter massiliensis]QBJ26374.1 acyl-CoA dehydrogenase [Haematobacter massiliensis]
MLLTPEHEEFRRSIRAWVEAEINPHVDAWEAAGIFPAHQVFASAGRLGFLGATKPEAYGGLGLDESFGAVLAEELGAIRSGGVAMAIGVQTDMCTPALAAEGGPALCEEWLRPAIEGRLVGCIGVSEAGGGSDVAALRTSAVRDGADYVIDGSKMWITNGTQADFCCLLANTSDGPVHRNKSLIIVPMKTKGVQITRKIDKMGMCASDTAEIFFDAVRVPQANRIGEEGMGFIYQMRQFQIERIWGAMNAVGIMRRAIACTIAYTSERRTFGRPLIANQVVQFRLAELETEVESVSALAMRAVEEVVAGRDATRLATMAKLRAGRTIRRVADECLQFWGGLGFASESEINRIYRDARLVSIGGGADEVMLQILAKMMGLLGR